MIWCRICQFVFSETLFNNNSTEKGFSLLEIKSVHMLKKAQRSSVVNKSA